MSGAVRIVDRLVSACFSNVTGLKKRSDVETLKFPEKMPTLRNDFRNSHDP
jgi:hypothetical protein